MENMQFPREFQPEYYTEVNRMNPTEMNRINPTEMNRINPKIYDKVMPFVHKAIDNLDFNTSLTNEDLNNLANNIIAESNIMMNPPEHHNRETIFDTIKMLLMMELDDGDSLDWEDYAMPAISPFGFDGRFFFPFPFFFPFFPRRRHRRRRHRR